MADEDQKKREGSNADEVWNEHMESVGRKPRNKGRVKAMDPGTPEDPQLPGITGAEAEVILDENLERLLPEGEEVPEGDPEAYREAAKALHETGDPDAFVDALVNNPELMREGADGERVEVSVQEGEPVPFEELSEELGLDPERVTVKTKENGETKERTLRELRDGFMMREDYSKKTTEVAEKRKELDQALQQQNERLGLLAAAMEDQLNPYQQQTIKQTIKQVRAQQDQLRQQTIQEEVIPREMQKLTERLGVESQEDLEEAKRRIGAAAIDHYGFQPEELANVLDARLLHIANDAAKYREMKAQQQEAMEKAEKNRKRGSRTLKPGTSGQREAGNKELERAVRELRTPGGRPDVDKAADAILAAGIV